MKKILIISFLIFILLVAISLFIPAMITISKVKLVKATPNATYRSFSDNNIWKKWWPQMKTKDTSLEIADNTFRFKNIDFILNPKTYDAIDISIKIEGTTIKSIATILPLTNDSVAIDWQGQMKKSYNPIKRIKNYIDAQNIKHNMGEILESLKQFLEKEENIYELNIREERVKDTFLIATKFTSDTYPSNTTIYFWINSIREYIKFHNAKEANYPMLHIIKENGVFNTMIAIPINKIIPQNKKFLFKRMIAGRILVTQVKGGIYSTDNAFKQLEFYMGDKGLTSPAIPFESLVTDRLKEPDSSTWITNIYYPIY